MDDLSSWFEAKIVSSIRPRGDEIKAFTSDPDSRANLTSFCANEDCRCLYVYQLSNGTLQSSIANPDEPNISRCITFVKLGSATKLTQSNLSSSVAFFDNSVDILESINWLSLDLYLPAVTNEDTSQTIVAGKKVMLLGDKYVDLMHRFMASSEFSRLLKTGSVALPYPSLEVLHEIKSQSKRSKSTTHVIETTIISWTKQLKILLKVDPVEDVVRVSKEAPVYGFKGVPCLIHEERIWQERVVSLRKIEAQLHSEVTSDLITYLEQQKNKYAEGVFHMRTDLRNAVLESLDNIKFLKPLQKCLDDVMVAQTVPEVCDLFKPLIHTLHLVWEYSGYFHKKVNFHNLVGVVANEVTLKACSFLNTDLLEDTKRAFQQLKEALQLCGVFRGVYLDKKTNADILNERRFAETKKEDLRTPKTPYYRAKVYPPTEEYDLWKNLSDNSNWSDSPWPEKNSASFDTLNSFVERCNDLLDFVETIHQFRLMRKVAEVGGAGSQGLDALVSEIHEQFEKAMKSFTVSHDDLLGIKSFSQLHVATASNSKPSFEEQFFNFRLVIRNLEKRLAAVLSHSFQQCRTIGSQLRILEVFEGVNNREVIQKAIANEDHFMVSSFLHELMNVKDMLTRNKSNVPEHVNVPPIVSKLKWQHALQKRIEVPMAKLKKVSPNSLESENGMQIDELYRELTLKLDKFRDKLLKDWQRGLNPEIKERLKDFILVVPPTEETDIAPNALADSRALMQVDSASAATFRLTTSGLDSSEVLRVNLDQSLLLLLREVHYLAQPPFEVRMPDTVKEIIRSMDFQTLRSLSARLEAIVGKYNYVMKSITPEERDLFHRKLTIISQLVEQGKSVYTWKMAETQDFIEHASQLVLNDLYYNLDKVKGNLREITEIFTLWSDGTLDIFHDRDPNRSYTMQELMEEQSQIISEHEAYLSTSGKKVHALLRETFECVEVSRGSPAWEGYLRNVDQFALSGLYDATFASLRHMYNELADANNSNPKSEPLLVVKLALVDGRLGFVPPLDKSSDEKSVQEAANEWMDQFLRRGSFVDLIFDGSSNIEEDSYHAIISRDEKIMEFKSKIQSLVDNNCQECKTLMIRFNDFYFLWADDIPTVFEEFLSGKLQPYPLREEVRGFLSDQATAAKSSRSDKTASESSNARSKLSKADRSSVPGFQASKKMTDRIFEHMPSLDAFETEIEIYKLARMRIDDFEDNCSIGWLKLDMNPIKEVLKGYANKAIWTYTDYLIQQVSTVLTHLDQFLIRIEPELERVTGDEHEFEDIMRIMHIFQEVSSQHAELDSKFKAMTRTVALVKKHGLGVGGSELPAELQRAFTSAPQRWNMLKSKVSLAKQRLGPTIHNQSQFITNKLNEFGSELKSLEADITTSIIYQRNCPVSSAFELIQGFRGQLEELNTRAQDLFELQELLQIPAADFKVINRVNKELDNLSSIWEMAERVEVWKKHWLDAYWFSIDTQQVEASASDLEAQLAEYPDACQHWDVMESLVESVNMVKAVLPLVDDLSNSAMRARHWKQLYRETKSAIQIDQDTVRYMTLGKLLNTNLHVYAEDIKKIVSRAQGDLTIEQMLNRFEEVWLGKLFTLKEHVKSSMELNQNTDENAGELTPAYPDTRRSSRMGGHVRDKIMSIAAPIPEGGPNGSMTSRSRASSARSTTTANRTKRISLSSLPAEVADMQIEEEYSRRMYLLDRCDEVFEKLETHQMELEKMRQSKEAGSFLDDIIKWQSIMQEMESVLKVWLNAQELWLKLDEIFSKSEIGLVLPKEAILFSSLNKSFRTLMRSTAQKPNILACCFYKGIRKTLEKMRENFEFCYSSLVRNLEKRKSRFPRFYFLSDEDVITMIAYGNDLSRAREFMFKVYENIGSLVFDTVNRDHTNQAMGVSDETAYFRITHLKSQLQEPLELSKPIICKGETERWLNDIAAEFKSTLKGWVPTGLEILNLDYWKQERDLIFGGSNIRDVGNAVFQKSSHQVDDTEDQNVGDFVPQIEITEAPKSSGSIPKNYIDIPSEIVYLAMSCDLTSRTKRAMDSSSVKELSDIAITAQRGLERISQLIVFLQDLRKRESLEFGDDEVSVDEMNVLHSAFHGEPEIEVTATMTELIQLEADLSEDPQPTTMYRDDMPRKAEDEESDQGSSPKIQTPQREAAPVDENRGVDQQRDQSEQNMTSSQTVSDGPQNQNQTSEAELTSEGTQSESQNLHETGNAESNGELGSVDVTETQTAETGNEDLENDVENQSKQEKTETGSENQDVDLDGKIDEDQILENVEPAIPPRTSSVHRLTRKNTQYLSRYYELARMPYQLKKLEGVINLLITWRDKIQRALDSANRNLLFSFYWQQMIKFQAEPLDTSTPIKIECFGETVSEYHFEYQGSNVKQVVSGQTDKVLVNMTMSLSQYLPIIMSAPAGSSKRETVRELCKVFGQGMFGLTCTRYTTTQTLENVLRGIASSGLWVTIHNVNYLRPNLLCLLGKMVQSLVDAIKNRKAELTLKPYFYPVKIFTKPGIFCSVDDKVKIESSNPDCAIIRPSILLSLPGSVVSQFRQISLSCPDMKTSYEASLLSKGFVHAKALARKLCMLSDTKMDIDEKLSTSRGRFCVDEFWPGSSWAPSVTQKALETARMNLEELRDVWKAKNETGSVTDEEEFLLEIQSLAASLKSVFVSKYPGYIGAALFKERLLNVMPEAENVPMTLEEQSARFTVQNDLLPAIRENSVMSFDRPEMSKGVQYSIQKTSNSITSETVESVGLSSSPYFLTRIQQLSEICTAQNVSIVCGEAGCGKSSVIKCYSSWLQGQGRKVTVDRLVVGTLPTHDLLGHYSSSGRWVDGGFNILIRSFASQQSARESDEPGDTLTRILVLDGVVNEQQMEVFGSLLHNSGKITFANNESLQLPPNIKIFWEVDSLAHLGPSVLTHVPVLSMNQSELTYQMVTSVWLSKQWKPYQPPLQKFIETYIPVLMDYSAKMLKGPLQGGTDRVNNAVVIREVVDSVTLLHKVRTLLTLIDGMLGTFKNAGEQILERFFCFAAIWSFGGLFWKQNRGLFSEWWHSTFISSPVPIKGTVWDYYVDSETCDWSRYDDNLPSYSAPTQCGIAPDAFVHTVSTQQLSNLVGLAQETGAPIMLVGENGCGKTSIVMDRIRGIWSNSVSGVNAIAHSANRTNAKSIWSVLSDNLEWKYADNFVPKGNKRLLCFIDDINMSEIDQFGNQSACEFIRQHLDCNGVFDPESMKWRSLSKTQYVTTVNPTLAQQKLSPRFLRHFMVFNCPYPSNSEIHSIFKALLMNHFLPSDLTAPVGTTLSSYRYNQEKLKVEKLLSTTVLVTTEVHNRLRTMFLPTAQRSHYVFTIRDISTIFTNLCLSLRPNCSRKNIILLWEHENQWVFGRRLIDHVDYDRYHKVFTTSARKEFSNDEDLDWLVEAGTSPSTFSSLEETLSGVVIAGPQPGTVSRDGRYHDNYRPFEDVEDVKSVIKESIKEFNKSKPNIRVSLYKSTVEEVCRIARMLHSPHGVGHAQLVADGSPGVVTLIVALAAHLSNYTHFQIRPSKLAAAAQAGQTTSKCDQEYSMEHFKKEISAAYKRAGVNSEKIVLMLTPHEANCEDEILSHLQELIVSGPPVNSLFSPEERTSIVNSIRSAVIQSGIPYSRQTAWEFFLNNVRQNFRVVLVTSASKKLFQRRCIMFPHLTTHMNIVFFPHWKLQQLIEVANYHVSDENTAHVLANMHLAIRQQDGAEKTSGEHFTLTNTTYEKFIERFVYLRNKRLVEIESVNDQVTRSLANISEGHDIILKLKRSLEHEKSVLQNQVEGTLKLMGQIGQAKAIARQQLKVLYKQHDKLINLKKALPEFKLAYERACYKTEKLYGETVKLVNNLDTNALGDLRSMTKPDQEVQDLLAIIIKILKPANSDSTWTKGAKRQMANLERFKEELLRFDQEPMKRSTMETVEPLVNKPTFTPEQMTLRANDNKSAGDLTQWILNVIQYNKLKYERVKPLKEKVERTAEELKDAENKMAALDSKRASLENRLSELAKDYEKATIDKNNQEKATAKMEDQVCKAEDFSLVMLQQVDVCQNVKGAYEDRVATVCGTVALCAAFAAYLGPYSFKFRAEMMLRFWPDCLTQRGIPVQFDFIDSLNGRRVVYSFNDNMLLDGSEGVSDNGDDNGEFMNENVSVGDEKQEPDIRFSLNGSAQNFAVPDPNQSRGEREGSEAGTNLVQSFVTGNETESGVPQGSEGEDDSGRTADEETTQDSPYGRLHQETDPDISKPSKESEINEKIKSQEVSSNRLTPSEDRESGHFASENRVLDYEREDLNTYEKCLTEVVKFLIGESKVNKWLAAGYTMNQVENAAIILSFGHVRPPLIIDPDNEAEDWIKTSFQNIKLISLNSKDPDRKSVIADALKEGRIEEEDEDEEVDDDELMGGGDKPEGAAEESEEPLQPPATLLISGVTERLDSLLGPLIFNKNMQREEAKWEEPGLIAFDGHLMICNEDYALIMTCPDKKAKFNSGISSVTTLVSYTPNELSLYQKLLDVAFRILYPKLASERSRILKAIWRCQQVMRDLEQKLYEKLTSFSGKDIWMESAVLKKIVETMDFIEQKMTTYRLVLERQDALIWKLSPIAEQGAAFLYLIQNLQELSNFYSFPLEVLLDMFKQVLSKHVAGSAQDTSAAEDDDDVISLHEQFISTRGTRAVESDDEDDEGDESDSKDKSHENEDSSSLSDERSRQPMGFENEAQDDELLFVEPDEKVLRLGSADYVDPPSNKVKKIAKELTEKLFSSMSKSLNPDHRLMFSVFLTLKLKWPDILTEELLFLFYGNLQVRMDSKAIEDFGISSSAVPDWIPKDRFDDVISVSVIQEGPLHGLCREIVENSEEWQRWYSIENCECFPLPCDDRLPWKEIHKLVVVRLLRPDRFCSALKLFAQENLPMTTLESSSGEHFKLSRELNLESNTGPGFLVSLPPTDVHTSADLTKFESSNVEEMLCDQIQTLARELNVGHVNLIDLVTETSASQVAETVEKYLLSSEVNWVILKHVQLMNETYISKLLNSIAYVTQQQGFTEGSKIWVIGEPHKEYTLPNLFRLSPLSYDSITNQIKLGGDLVDCQLLVADNSKSNIFKPELLSRAIQIAIKRLPKSVWGKISGNSNLRNHILALCIVNGILIARGSLTTQGMSRVYAFMGQGLAQAVDKFLSSVREAASTTKSSSSVPDESEVKQQISFDTTTTLEHGASSDEFVEFLVQHVYGRIMSCDSDLKVVDALLRNTFHRGDLKEEVRSLTSYPIPLPPANLSDSDQIAHWFSEKCPWKSGSTAEVLEIAHDRVTTLCLTKNEVYFDWMRQLGSIYLPLTPSLSNTDLEYEVNQVRMSIDLCYDHLPSLLNVADDLSQLFSEPVTLSFPYHPPSRYSSTVFSSDSASADESLSLLLQQESLFFNEWICYIRQDLHEIESRLLRGMQALPEHLQKAARSLAKEEVPLYWLPSCELPTTHTLYSFLKNLGERRDQFSDWLKRGLVPSKRNPNAIGKGSLREIWFGGLVNPSCILSYLKAKASNDLECHMDEIAICVEVSTAMNKVKLNFREADEIMLVVNNLYLEGSNWDLYGQQLTQGAPPKPQKMPPVVLKPMKKAEMTLRRDGEQYFECPIFTNKSRRVLVSSLDLACRNDSSVYHLAGTCLLLDGGPGVHPDLSLSSRRMRLAHIKTIPKDIPDDSQSDIISTSRTKLSKGGSLQSLIKRVEASQKQKDTPDATARNKKTPRSSRLATPSNGKKAQMIESDDKQVDELSDFLTGPSKADATKGADKKSKTPSRTSTVVGGSQKLRDVGSNEDQVKSDASETQDDPVVTSRSRQFPVVASPDTIEPTSPAKTPTGQNETVTSRRSRSDSQDADLLSPKVSESARASSTAEEESENVESDGEEMKDTQRDEQTERKQSLQTDSQKLLEQIINDNNS